jgi:hypothetical protein
MLSGQRQHIMVAVVKPRVTSGSMRPLALSIGLPFTGLVLSS